jgi:hypothetical protein
VGNTHLGDTCRSEALGTAYAGILAHLRNTGRAAPGCKISEAANAYVRKPTTNQTPCRLEPQQGFNFARFNQRARFQPPGQSPIQNSSGNHPGAAHRAPPAFAIASQPSGSSQGGYYSEMSQQQKLPHGAQQEKHAYCGPQPDWLDRYGGAAQSDGTRVAPRRPPPLDGPKFSTLVPQQQGPPAELAASITPSVSTVNAPGRLSQGVDGSSENGHDGDSAIRAGHDMRDKPAIQPSSRPIVEAALNKSSPDAELPEDEEPKQHSGVLDSVPAKALPIDDSASAARRSPSLFPDPRRPAVTRANPPAAHAVGLHGVPGRGDMQHEATQSRRVPTMESTLNARSLGMQPSGASKESGGPAALEQSLRSPEAAITTPPVVAAVGAASAAASSHWRCKATPEKAPGYGRTVNPLDGGPRYGRETSTVPAPAASAVKACANLPNRTMPSGAAATQPPPPAGAPFSVPPDSSDDSLTHSGAPLPVTDAPAAAPVSPDHQEPSFDPATINSSLLLKRACEHADHLEHLCTQLRKAHREKCVHDEQQLMTQCAHAAAALQRVQTNIQKELHISSGTVHAQLEMADGECIAALTEWRMIEGVSEVRVLVVAARACVALAIYKAGQSLRRQRQQAQEHPTHMMCSRVTS